MIHNVFNVQPGTSTAAVDTIYNTGLYAIDRLQ